MCSMAVADVWVVELDPKEEAEVENEQIDI